MENDNKDGKHLITADIQASKAAKNGVQGPPLILNTCSNKRNIMLTGYMTCYVMICIQPCLN